MTLVTDRPSTAEIIDCANAARDFVLTHERVTFARLADHLADCGFETQGCITMLVPGGTAAMWPNSSLLFQAVVEQLMLDGSVGLAPTTNLDYLLDGRRMPSRIRNRDTGTMFDWEPIALFT
jgi:hypothetical protein